jgi:alpha-L-fucosidase
MQLHLTLAALILSLPPSATRAEEMDKMWGGSTVKTGALEQGRGQRFADGNYAMFIHWGLYSTLANEVGGKTHYGIGEWIMNDHMAGIPVDRYKKLARDFNPSRFDPAAIARLAKDAGMRYVIITSKHHDGFAMYHSDACDFNIVDATPYGRDPMKDLAKACEAEGLGFGFYYSHNQDWTFPGGGGGPASDANGNPADFDSYFHKKCLPQVKEITTGYGPIELVWFDTPGSMPKHYVEELVSVVRKNQPRAMVSGRAGHGLGDYQTLGDMEVPAANIDGLWETVDTTNDSWGYAKYDENWKSPREILHRLISTVARGGTYMLNIGPRGDGTVPQRAAESLRAAGAWIRRHPDVIYGAGPSPWKHALPWGDVTTTKDRMFLTVFDRPASGRIILPGLTASVRSARLQTPDGPVNLAVRSGDSRVTVDLPPSAPQDFVTVIELLTEGPAKVDSTFALDPELRSEIPAGFCTATGASRSSHRWMEKFGEWKHAERVTSWTPGSSAEWEIIVLEPGDYAVELTYSGKGRLVWNVSVEGGETIRNQQNSSHNYQTFPIGWLRFSAPGRHKVRVSCADGEIASASLSAISFERVLCDPRPRQ